MSSGVRAELSPYLHRFTRPNPVAPTVFRAVVCSALLLVGLAAVGNAQPNANIVFNSLRCIDCIDCGNGAGVTDPGQSCFINGGSLKTSAGTGGCQDYAQFNLYENWNSSEANKSLQVNIRNARWTSDADFWYFQIETSETTWDAPFYVASHIEVAFGCTAADGFSLLITYIPSADQVGTTWDNLATANITAWRDTDGDVGDPGNGGAGNDGPSVPLGSTTNYPCSPPSCDGYDDLFDSPPQNSAFARLRNDAGGQAMVEIAVDRSDFAAFMGLGTNQSSDFVPCDARFWQMQTSTLSGPSHFAWNDRQPSTDLDSASWAMDSCGTALSVPVELQKFEID